MTFQELLRLVRSDHFRYTGQTNWRSLAVSLLYKSSFKHVALYRTCEYLKNKRLLFPLYVLARILLRHWGFRYGISIPMGSHLGPGFKILHPGGIVINRHAKIGANCTICQGVTIGQVFRGKRTGFPTIGDRVFIGPGAVVLGNITVGNDVVIGANAVVIDDIPDQSVVAAPPGQVISAGGSAGYAPYLWQD